MKKCTDLNSVKEVARCLLYTDVHKVENYSFIVTQIPVGIILYEMKKGLNKRFFQKKHEKHLIFLSEYGIIRLYFIR